MALAKALAALAASLAPADLESGRASSGCATRVCSTPRTLPAPDEIAAEIVDDLRSALEQIEGILGDLEAGEAATPDG